MTATYNFIKVTGTISVDTSDLLSDVEQEWKTALGAGLDTDASTPQGTLIQTETLARTSVMKNNAELGSLLNPDYAYGIYLDAIAALLGISRGKNTYTMGYQLKVTGATGQTTVVPKGNRVKTQNGDIFVIAQQFTIPTSGTALANVQALEYGNIPLPLNEPLEIVDGVIGWGSIETTATTTVVIGGNALTDSQLKASRRRRLFQQGLGSLGAIYASVSKLDGVTSVMAVENITGAPGDAQGITFGTPNGVWICVAGGDDQQIADALWSRHMGGQPYDFGVNQGVPVNPPDGIQVVDPGSQRAYFVKFTRPVMYDLYAYVEVKQGTGTATAHDIQQTVVDYANGLINGEDGFVVGASVSAFEIGGAIAQRYPGMYVKKVAVAAVPSGSPSPVYPTGFGEEWVANPYDQATTVLGMVTVSLV